MDFYYLLNHHPILAFAFVPTVLVSATVIEWQFRRPKLAPLLAGLTRVPPTDPDGRKIRLWLGYVLLGLLGATVLVAYLYDQRLSALIADSKTVDFYTDISRNLALAGVFGVLLCALLLGWSRITAKMNWHKLLLGVFILASLTLVQIGLAVANFYDPQPAIVLSHEGLSCQWRVNWTDIADVSMRIGRRGEEYAQIEFVKGQSPLANRKPSGSCEIDSLNAGSVEVYEAIYRGWQAAKSSAALPGSAMMDRLRSQLGEILPGSSHEKVVAVLGEPAVNGAQGVTFYVYPRTGAAEASSRRVVAVYFDADRRVSRLAVYGLSGGKVIDDLSHEILAVRTYEYPLLRFVLLDPKR